MSGLLIVMASMALAGTALQGEPPETDVPGAAIADIAADEPLQPLPTSLEVTLLAGVWLPRLVGNVELGGPSIDLEDEFDLDSNEASLNLEFAIRKDEIWELWFGGFDFSTSVTGAFMGSGATFGSLVLSNGDPYRSTLDITSVAAELSVTVWRPFADGHSREMGTRNRTWDGHYGTDLRFSPQFGMRYIDVDQSVTTTAGTVDTGGEWLGVYAGMVMELDYRPMQRVPGFTLFRFRMSTALGPVLGGDGGFMWQIRVGGTVQFTDVFGVMVGYRLLQLNADNGSYTFNGGLQGMFLAGSIRF